MSASRVPAEQIFEALDGHKVSSEGSDWNVCVFSVTDENDLRWVQLSLEGRGRQILTMRLAPTHPPDRAFASLSHFLIDPFASDDVRSHVA